MTDIETLKKQLDLCRQQRDSLLSAIYKDDGIANDHIEEMDVEIEALSYKFVNQEKTSEEEAP